MAVLLRAGRNLALPAAGVLGFLLAWSVAAKSVETSLGQFPGPMAVAEQFAALYRQHRAERRREAAFYARQERRNAERVRQDPTYEPRIHDYTGKETFLDQIGTSLLTVALGFSIGAGIAIPLGIAIGLSRSLNTAFNPIIQVLKPISPLAWLPLVTMIVSAVYVSPDPLVPKSLVNSMITVTLCCLWPMVINTAVGVASIDKDLVNVSRVLSLSPVRHVAKIVIPASIPMIFTGMRLSIGIAWMVLIAAEMLAQNPGLGKFVWDEFQNGSSESLSRILAAAIVIGFIGFLLDRGMLSLQRFASWDKASAAR
ncbi:MAG TPA: ABC transporter permease [Woeseiaceae bacterium]|nr:ABC transporter permease [Woeseiaceae bacterium]